MADEIMTSGNYKKGFSPSERTAELDTGTISPIEFADKDHEGNNDVFQKVVDGGVDFRTVGWKRASMIFVKSNTTYSSGSLVI
jgi:hypothetical protein